MNSMEEVKTLSNEELRHKLEQFGVSVGPITGTTRFLFEKKLLRLHGSLTDQTDQPAKTDAASSYGAIANGQSSTESSSRTQVIETLTADRSADTETGNKDNENQEPTVYFAISVPEDILLQHHSEARVFTNKKAALDAVKRTAGARFKVFSSREEALYYASLPADKNLLPGPTREVGTSAQVPVGEGTAFRGPKIQDLMALRKALERGEVETLRQKAWENPRYLVSSGDTPTILQEGFRYNALHVTSMKNQPQVAAELLDILSNPSFMTLLYPGDAEHTRSLRMEHLTDLYLNMPDKGNQETTLHFACKFGHVDMVKVLLAHPATKQQLKNRNGQTPLEIVCSRSRDNCAEAKASITQLFEAQCFVPLLRTDDNSVLPMVGKPWSPTQDAENVDLDQVDPFQPDFAIKAFAGPMSPAEAEKFRLMWVTPPSPKGSPKAKAYQTIRRGDLDKGLERIGRELAKEMTVPWSEYWDFLDAYLDLSSDEGLASLEEYLTEQQSTVPSVDSSISDITLQGHGDLSISNVHPEPFGDKSVTEECVKHGHPMSAQPTPLSPISQLGADFERLCLTSPASPRVATNSDRVNVTDCRTDAGGMACLPANSQGESCVTDLGAITLITPVHELATKTTCLVPPTAHSGMCGAGTTHLKMGSGNCGDGEASCSTGLDLLQLPSRVRTVSEGSDSSTESYHTAAQSLPRRSPIPEVWDDNDDDDDDDDPCTPIASRTAIDTFLLGEEPTKLDSDVLNALHHVQVSPVDYPHVARWRHHVLSYSEQTRHRWRTPSRRRLTLSTPRGIGSSAGRYSQPLSPISPLLLRSTPGRRRQFSSLSPQPVPMSRNLMSSFMSEAPDQT